MQLKLKDNHVFRNTVDGVYVEVGGGSVEVDVKVGRYLLENFPDRLEEVAAPIKEWVAPIKKSKEVK